MVSSTVGLHATNLEVQAGVWANKSCIRSTALVNHPWTLERLALWALFSRVSSVFSQWDVHSFPKPI